VDGYRRKRLKAALLLGLLFVFGPALPAASAPAPQRERDLVRLVRQDCGSCHGMTLAGGLGPPLLPAVLRERPVEALVQTVLHGRHGTPMPPWQKFLSEAEAQWIVERLVEGFPEQ
jgi:cytochrome c55X